MTKLRVKRVALSAGLAVAMLPPCASAEEALSFCLARERIGVTIGETFTPLPGNRPSDHTLTLNGSLTENLHGFGAALVPLKERPSPVGSIEGLARPLDQSVRQGATLLLAFGLDARELPLKSPLLAGDQYPLRTVKLLLNGWIVDPRSRDVLAEFSVKRTYAANSTDEAVSQLTATDLADPLAQALRKACAQRTETAMDPRPSEQTPNGVAAQRRQSGAPPKSSPQRGAEAVADDKLRLPIPTYHALIIANKNYRQLGKLDTPLEDATEVGKILREKYGFKTVTMLPDATRQDITSKLAQLRASLTSDDSLLIYYAGHGQVDQQTERGYWLPVDAERTNEGNWVSNDDITNYLKGMRARHVLIVSDSCYSGTLTREDSSLGMLPGGDMEWINRMIDRRARTALTSGGNEPVKDKGGKGHSVFAQAFLDVLRENDQPRDMRHLFEQISHRVVVNAPQTPQYAEIRFADHQGGDFIFIPLHSSVVLRASDPVGR